MFTNVEYTKLIRHFKSEEIFNDYLKITEGYLIEKNKRKYDELFYSDKVQTLKDFRAFNGRDKVYFSMDFINFKVLQQADAFQKYLETRFMRGSTRVSAEILIYFRMIVADRKFIYNAIGIRKEDLTNGRFTKQELIEIKKEIQLLEEAKEKNDSLAIENYLKEKLIVWFKFFLARTMLQRYTNIPSGLLVVKIEDYSMRMITEVYNDKKLVNISRNQNDGLSDSFNGDEMVNLFLFLWNAFMYGRKTKLLKDLEFNLNTISDTAKEFDEEVEAIVKNMEMEIKENKK